MINQENLTPVAWRDLFKGNLLKKGYKPRKDLLAEVIKILEDKISTVSKKITESKSKDTSSLQKELTTLKAVLKSNQKTHPILRRIEEIREKIEKGTDSVTGKELEAELTKLKLDFLDSGTCDRVEELFERIFEKSSKVLDSKEPIEIELPLLGKCKFQVGEDGAGNKFLYQVSGKPYEIFFDKTKNRELTVLEETRSYPKATVINAKMDVLTLVAGEKPEVESNFFKIVNRIESDKAHEGSSNY